MAFEYAGVKEALRRWIVANVNAYFPTDATVWTWAPNLTDLADFPAAIIRHATVTPTVPTVLKMPYVLEIDFVTRAQTSREAVEQMDALLKAFDTAWLDESKQLDASLGYWERRTQEDLQTEFDPVMQDEFGLIVYSVMKRVRITERIAARTF